MSSNINYSIIDQGGAIVIRQMAKSFNLDHITDKDIVSFYRNFSSYAMFDTGLMPLSGTGILAIRSAGNHTQITFQHAPQISLINWGANENDPEAKAYNVAQPYRIWIGDLIDGNMFGARMFYSIYPITSPDQPLYHLNLPNTNCKGYRGNSVGWQCLYHNESWLNLPFNEKIIRFAERCSGVETYNDANMSETDGPRFYQERKKPSYLWDPAQWQSKTEIEGLNWVYNDENWIPILVTNQDNQDRHDDNGIPLTIQMAMLGDYQSYYTDPYRPKPVNILSRSDLKLPSKKVTDWVARSHNNSLSSDVSYDSLEATKEHRVELNTKFVNVNKLGGHDIDDENEEENEEENKNLITVKCPFDGSNCQIHKDEVYNDSDGNSYCEPCWSENVVHCENNDSWLPHNDDRVVWIESESIYIDATNVIFQSCQNCSALHWTENKPNFKFPIYTSASGDHEFCSECLPDKLNSPINNDENKIDNCYGCGTTVVNGPDWSHIFPNPKIIGLSSDSETNSKLEPVVINAVYCSDCSTKHVHCPTGHFVKSFIPNSLITLPKQYEVKVFVDENTIVNTSLSHLCSECVDEEILQLTNKISKHPDGVNDPTLKLQLNTHTNLFSSKNLALERFQKSVIEKIAFSSSACVDLDNFEKPF